MVILKRVWGCAGLAAAVVTAMAAVSSCSGPAATAEEARCGPHWVATWTASPSDALGPVVAAGTTLRELAYVHLGGSRLRLTLSNRFSATPVVFGAVTVGVQSHGATLSSVPVSVLFDGRKAVTVPARGSVTSDSLSMPVQALTELEVSVFLERSSGPATEHKIAQSTLYTSRSGGADVASDRAGAAYSAVVSDTGGRQTAMPWLDEIDVEAPAAVTGLVAFGDSLTDGFQGDRYIEIASPDQLDRNSRYPDDLARRLHSTGDAVAVVDAGISGNRLLSNASASGPYAGPSGISRFAADALEPAGVRTVLLFEGINDLAGGTQATALEVADTRLVNEAHRDGVRVLLATLTPTGGVRIPHVAEAVLAPALRAVERQRVLFNAWVMRQHVADGAIDFAAAVADPARPGQLRVAYDGSDHVHLSAAGYQALANAVPLALVQPAPGPCPAAVPAHS